MTTTIRITPDYKALRDLLGGDEPALIELRQGIVEEFARKHLKAVVNEPLMHQVQHDLERDFERRVNELIGTVTREWTGTSITLRSEFRDAISARAKMAAEQIVYAQIDQAVTAYFERIDVGALVRTIASQRITSTVNQMVNEEIKRRLAAVAQD